MTEKNIKKKQEKTEQSIKNRYYALGCSGFSLFA